MSAIDDLLSRRRRGALSEADERRVQMAVQTSREHQLTLLAGEEFERAGAPQSGDAALVHQIVRQVEGEWSGTFQRVVARRRLSRWVSLPVLIAGVAAASLGAYRALRAPADNAHPVALVAQESVAQESIAQESTAQESTAQAVEEAPSAVLPGVLRAGVPPEELPRAVLPVRPQPESTSQPFAVVPTELPVPSVELTSPLAARLSLEDPAAVPSPLAEVVPVLVPPAVSSGVAAAPAAAVVPARGWRLPRPKPHAERVAEADGDLAGAAPTLSAPVVATAGGAELAPLPDLESSQALFRRANQLRRSDWDAAASLYERLALRHSESREAGVAEMALGKHALAEGRARQALQWFEAYQRRTGGELAAEAVWGQARALESLGENERARELWRRLIEQYPASAYAAAAREQLGP